MTRPSEVGQTLADMRSVDAFFGDGGEVQELVHEIHAHSQAIMTEDGYISKAMASSPRLDHPTHYTPQLEWRREE